MKLKGQIEKDMVNLKLSGNLAGHAGELRRECNGWLDEIKKTESLRVLVDIRGVSGIDSSSLYTLVHFIPANVGSRGGKIGFVGLGRGLRNIVVLAYIGMASVSVYEDVGEAQKEMRNAA